MTIRNLTITIISILICFTLLIVFLAFSRPSGTLFYNGRHLTEWLLLVQSSSPQEQGLAEQAVREIGPNALPFLEELVENAHFSSFKVKVGKWLRQQDFPVHEIRRMVFNGYGSLGDIAKPSVPFLLEKLKDNEPTVRSTAVGALGWIGPSASNAVPSLITLLNDNVGYVRRDTASALGQICVSSNDAVVISALNEALNDKDSQVQGYAKRALESVQQNAGIPEEVE